MSLNCHTKPVPLMVKKSKIIRMHSRVKKTSDWTPLLLAVGCALMPGPASANPEGGTVTQGSATFSSVGSHFTITTSDRAFINWNSFNIGLGQTTTFIQPSSSSVVWNKINDANPSQILGNLNANGYVILQNESGFFIGGQAAISTRGLLLTTAPVRTPDVLGGGVWQFDTPSPTAKIINYGNINVSGGAPAYLIASDIQNHGTIEAPGGQIGLYAGKTVLVSTSPDGRGLSAEVTLPEGSVDNQGRLIADGGRIALQAKVVNQNNLVQANSVREVNGVIELFASDSLNLGANSVIAARGDAEGVSAGGTVTIKSQGAFTDQSGSKIDISGGAGGGHGGHVEISGREMGAIQSTVSAAAQAGYTGGRMLIDPVNLTLDSAYISSLNSLISGGLSQLTLEADNDITLTASWTLANQTAPALLSLSAGHNIIFNTGTALRAGENWNVDLRAGLALPNGIIPTSGNYGIYLNGTALLQGFNGSLNLWAANEVQVGWSGSSTARGAANSGTGRILTYGGGGINVTTLYGDINTGSSTAGFNYLRNAPYYTPFTVTGFGNVQSINYNQSLLGGISTAAGGDVTLTAGRDVTSYLPTGTASSVVGDPGSGAFGSQPGNVTVTAGGSVFGHFVVVNGIGSINASQNIGSSARNVALSLVKGSWNLNSAGDIYLQEVRNPNGVFNNDGGSTSAGYHLFDYDPLAALTLTAGNGVYLTGQNLPRRVNEEVPVLLPPSLTISAGAGGINLLGSMTLFPSPNANLHLTTRPGSGGNFTAFNRAALVMSDSAQMRWFKSSSGVQPFSSGDHGSVPMALNNSEPVTVDIAGNMENVTLQTSKKTEIKVGGDMVNVSFSGQNLQANDVTSIEVGGRIYYPGSFNWIFLAQAIAAVPTANLPPGAVNNWYTLLSLALDPARVASLTIPNGTDPSQYSSYLSQVSLFGNSLQSSFAYNPTTKKLTFVGTMSAALLATLSQPLTVVRYDALGRPVVDASGHFVTDKITWVSATEIAQLYQASLGAPSLSEVSGGLVVGGTGQFDVRANSISLGNSYGIISLGNGNLLGRDYSTLAPYISGGAAINVTVQQDLRMSSSTIASLAGGAVTVKSEHGAMELGSQELVDFEAQIMRRSNLGLGIYTTGGGDVTAIAYGNINVESSRIGTFNGGNVSVRSESGNVNAGNGGRVQIPINVFSPFANLSPQPFQYVYANGIVAETLVRAAQVPGSAALPGNILVETPRGDIISGLGGILQLSLNGNLSPGPTITLIAGSDEHVGNIDLGKSGVIGGTINVQANGNVTGLVISRENANVQAGQNFSGTVLSGGTANLAAGGNVSGTVIGVGGVNASGGSGVSASLLGQNVSVNGGAAQSTLGTSATASSTSQAAAQQSSNEGQQVASVKTDDEDDKKKKAKNLPQIRRAKRVTVILPRV